MGEWRIQVSVRVRPALRAELEKYAAKERRSLGNLGAVILEWAFEQLKVAGSTERLLKYQLGKKEEKKWGRLRGSGSYLIKDCGC